MPSITWEPIKCLSKVLVGTSVACGSGISKGLDVVFRVSSSIAIMSLVLSFKSWKLNNGVFTSFYTTSHIWSWHSKSWSVENCVFSRCTWTLGTWEFDALSLWCSSLLPPCQQGAFFFHVERMKKLWHDCLNSSNLGNRIWTRCESISLNYLPSGKNSKCHTSLLCCNIGRAKKSSKFWCEITIVCARKKHIPEQWHHVGSHRTT